MLVQRMGSGFCISMSISNMSRLFRKACYKDLAITRETQVLSGTLHPEPENGLRSRSVPKTLRTGGAGLRIVFKRGLKV